MTECRAASGYKVTVYKGMQNYSGEHVRILVQQKTNQTSKDLFDDPHVHIHSRGVDKKDDTWYIRTGPDGEKGETLYLKATGSEMEAPLKGTFSDKGLKLALTCSPIDFLHFNLSWGSPGTLNN